MEPIFTLPYPEFCVAQQLARWLPASRGYSLYAPVSRQQPGVDLVLARRRGSKVGVACIQVKSSPTYSRRTAPTARTRRPFRYDTSFNHFECPPQAAFSCLVSLYPSRVAAHKPEPRTWCAPQVLPLSPAAKNPFMLRAPTA